MASRASRLSPLAVAASVLVGLTGCYGPTIKNGGLTCSRTFVMDCPAGYKCLADNRCWLAGTKVDGGDDVATDARVDSSNDVPAVDAPTETKPDALVCIVPPASCAPMGGATCDPLCQTGCPRCDQKCSVNTAGTSTCNPILGSLTRQLGESCTIDKPGAAAQSDNCAPGLLCIQASCDSSCFKFCRDNADCPGSECSRTLPGGAKYCDVPVVACNPVTIIGDTNCPGSAQGCYVSGSVPDETRCDCPFNGQHEGEVCTVSRDCLPGLLCADPNGQNHFVCERACKLTGPTSGCTAPSTCNAIKGSQTFGFCN